MATLPADSHGPSSWMETVETRDGPRTAVVTRLGPPTEPSGIDRDGLADVLRHPNRYPSVIVRRHKQKEPPQ